MFQKKYQLWAGTDDALATALAAQTRFEAASVAELQAMSASDGSEDDKVPHMFSQHGEVGVISIRGPLSNSDSIWAKYFGVATYPDIREALAYAAGNPEVKGILLAINSGGGAVNGVEDTSRLMAQINKSIKPVYTHTDGMMASGGYWLGVNGRKVFASSTSIVGSIGVITTHMEQSEALKNEGIGVTVIRAGKYKALANPYEKLTDQAKEEIQSKANDIYDIFIGHVAEQRGVTAAVADQKMGQGREFLGSRAAEVGLTDGVKNFEETLAFVQRAVSKVDTSKSLINNGKKQEGSAFMPRASLTPQQLAAIEAGASIEDVSGASASTEDQAAAAAAASTAASSEADAAAAAAAAGATEGDAAQAAAAATAPSAPADVVSYLQAQVADKDKLLLEANVKIHNLEASAAETKTTFDGLVEIARGSLQKISIALGGTGDAVASLSPTQLLADHAAMSTKFKERFKVGGVAVTTPETVKGSSPAAAAEHSALAVMARSAGKK